VAKTFTETLKDLRSGQADVDAGAALGELVEAVRLTGRGGSVLIELKVAPVSKGDGNQVLVTDMVKVKKPLPQNGNTVLFTTNDNVLQRKDPRQPELSGLRDVSTSKVADFNKKDEAASV